MPKPPQWLAGAVVLKKAPPHRGEHAPVRRRRRARDNHNGGRLTRWRAVKMVTEPEHGPGVEGEISTGPPQTDNHHVNGIAIVRGIGGTSFFGGRVCLREPNRATEGLCSTCGESKGKAKLPRCRRGKHDLRPTRGAAVRTIPRYAARAGRSSGLPVHHGDAGGARSSAVILACTSSPRCG